MAKDINYKEPPLKYGSNFTLIDFLKLGGTIKLNYKDAFPSWYHEISLSFLDGEAFFQGMNAPYLLKLRNYERALYCFMHYYKSPDNLGYVLDRMGQKGKYNSEEEMIDFEGPIPEDFMQFINEEKALIAKEHAAEFTIPEWTTAPLEPTQEELDKFKFVENTSDLWVFLGEMDKFTEKHPDCRLSCYIQHAFYGSTSISASHEEGEPIKTIQHFISFLREKNETEFKIGLTVIKYNQERIQIFDKTIKINAIMPGVA